MAKRITLKDLIDADLLRPGEQLTCEPRRGDVHTARLAPDGSIRDDRATFRTPSDWARHVAGGSRNGWRDVRARGRPLEHFRSRLLQGLPTMRQPEGGAAAKHLPKAEPQPPVSSSSAEIQEPESIEVQLLERIVALTPNEFEALLVRFFQANGFSNVRATGRSGDQGIDGEFEIPLLNIKAAFQAKRYAPGNNVGIEPIQRLQGSMASTFDRGIFVTTSDFTPAAKGWVQETGAPLVLIDGAELARQMTELGLGVKMVPVVEKHLDDDFFARLATGSR